MKTTTIVASSVFLYKYVHVQILCKLLLFLGVQVGSPPNRVGCYLPVKVLEQWLDKQTRIFDHFMHINEQSWKTRREILKKAVGHHSKMRFQIIGHVLVVVFLLMEKKIK